MWIILKSQPLIIWLTVFAVALFALFRVVLETRSPSKTAAYILLIILFPIGGPILYFLVGVNYRKRRIYNKKLVSNEVLFEQVKTRILNDSNALRQTYEGVCGRNRELIDLLLGESLSMLSANHVTTLINGEQKFPTLLEDLEQATDFIHLEYYIFQDDDIGNRIKDILIRKAKEGVAVRFIFDDFGSHRLWRKIVDELRSNGVQVFPFYRIHFILFANRINYRDHRKVVIIDGRVAFIGGINVADRYINSNRNKLFWRDNHIRIEGPAVLTLQYHFLCNWNFCSDENLGMEARFFPEHPPHKDSHDLVQIVTGGPDYPRQSIMLSYFTAIMSARESVYITSPYFIPNESILNAVKKAAYSGKDVRILIPEISDSSLVDAASRFYVMDMLEAGVKVYLYQKGFVHAKTVLIDNNLSIVGTANMDLRSFDLNFEINAVVYSERINQELKKAFLEDLENSTSVALTVWEQRSKVRMFLDGMARILAPLL